LSECLMNLANCEGGFYEGPCYLNDSSLVEKISKILSAINGL
jgi:hypothetical protein